MRIVTLRWPRRRLFSASAAAARGAAGARVARWRLLVGVGWCWCAAGDAAAAGAVLVGARVVMFRDVPAEPGAHQRAGRARVSPAGCAVLS